MENRIRFPAIEAARVRVTFANPADGGCGLTDLEIWGSGKYPYQPARPPLGNLACNSGSGDFPKATASFADRFGGKPGNAIDGKIIYNTTPVETRKLRVVFTHIGQGDTRSGLSEIEVWAE